MSKSWWETLYEDKFKDAEFWSMPDEKWVEKQVTFFTHLTHPAKGKLLDLGCGTGIHIAQLNGKGFDAVGVEFSETLVQKAHEINPKSSVFQGDMRHFLPSDKVDAITFFDTSFGIFDDTENADLLKHCASLLNKDGHIYIDYLNPEFWKNMKEPIVIDPYMEEGIVLKRNYSYDEKKSLLTDKCRVFRGEEEVKSYPDQRLKLYTQDKLDELLNLAGFRDIQFFGSKKYNYDLSYTDLKEDSAFAVAIASVV